GVQGEIQPLIFIDQRGVDRRAGGGVVLTDGVALIVHHQQVIIGVQRQPTRAAKPLAGSDEGYANGSAGPRVVFVYPRRRGSRIYEEVVISVHRHPVTSMQRNKVGVDQGTCVGAVRTNVVGRTIN